MSASGVIDSLIWRHKDVTELSATLQRVEYPGQDHAICFVDGDGLFAATQYASYYGPTRQGKSWRDKPQAFQWFDGTELVCDQSGDGTYAERWKPPADFARGCPGPIQWRHIPWPVLEKIVGCLRTSDDATAQVVGDVVVVQSEKLRLKVEVNDDSTLAAIHQHHEGGGSTRYEYSGTRGAPLDRPAEAVRKIHTRTDGRQHVSTYRYEGWARAPVPRFDARAMGIDVMDAVTRDVYSPEGEFLYNKDERDALTEEVAGPRRRRGWTLAGVGGGVVALALGAWWWRRRRG